MTENKFTDTRITRISTSAENSHANVTDKKPNMGCKNLLTPSARRAFERYPEMIVNEFFSGRPMATIRTHYGLKQHELEQLLRERARGAA